MASRMAFRMHRLVIYIYRLSAYLTENISPTFQRQIG
jgi:hypothetical protein